MSDYSKETDARILIDEMLRQAQWDPADKSQVLTEVSVRHTPGIIAEPAASYESPERRGSADGDEIPTGRADYVLLDRRGRPLAIVEAKRTAIEPYTAKQQALPYAKRIGSPFIFLTNGELIYFWDYGNDDARIVNSFFSRRDLERLVEMRETRKPLATIEIPDYYLRQGETRQVRPYQREAMQALDHAVELGKRRFLIELPTGTGKTDLVCLYFKRLIQAGRAERILFLVDREQLAKQALEAIQDILNQYSSYWLRPGMVPHCQKPDLLNITRRLPAWDKRVEGWFNDWKLRIDRLADFIDRMERAKDIPVESIQLKSALKAGSLVLNDALGVTALAATGDNHKCYLVDFSRSDEENPKNALRVFFSEQVKRLVLPAIVKEPGWRSPEWLISKSD